MQMWKGGSDVAKHGKHAELPVEAEELLAAEAQAVEAPVGELAAEASAEEQAIEELAEQPATEEQADETLVVEKRRKPVAAIVATLLVLVVAAAAVVVVVRPPFAEGVLQTLGIPPVLASSAQSVDSASASAASSPSSAATTSSSESLTLNGPRGAEFADATHDAEPTAGQRAEIEAYEKKLRQTPLVARCGPLMLHCPIAVSKLTGLLFHQASYKYGLKLETEIPEADYDRVADERTMRINTAQKPGQGNWVDGEALHLWRTTDSTDLDTSIDIGALPGTTVVSPVDGTVVLVKNYKLYDELDDIEIHIQPDGYPTWDVVLIHTTNPVVKAGDRVEAGITPISQVRDIETALTDVQLGFFTPEGIGGNHTHLQVNDATYPEYREKKLAGAYQVKENASASSASSN